MPWQRNHFTLTQHDSLLPWHSMGSFCLDITWCYFALTQHETFLTWHNIKSFFPDTAEAGLLPWQILTLWGLGTWNVTSPRDWVPFGDFFKFLLNQCFICHGSKFSSLFTIPQEHMFLWPQWNLFFGTTKFMML